MTLLEAARSLLEVLDQDYGNLPPFTDENPDRWQQEREAIMHYEAFADADILNQIQAELDGREWTPETLRAIL